jgi:hypothetical protein
MRSAFGDQKGEKFSEASDVKRTSVLRAKSRIQISAVPSAAFRVYRRASGQCWRRTGLE